MKLFGRGLAALLTFATLTSSLAYADEPAVSVSKDASGTNRTFLASHFDVPKGWPKLFYNADNDVFTCTLARPLNEGDTVAAMASSDQGWSIVTTKLIVGAKAVEFPVLASITISGSMHVALPATLKFKTDIKAGAVVHSKADGLSNTFTIKTDVAVKAGDSIPVFFINGPSILSIEPVDGAAKPTDSRPRFTAFVDGAKAEDKACDVELWRTVCAHAGMLSSSASSKPANDHDKK